MLTFELTQKTFKYPADLPNGRTLVIEMEKPDNKILRQFYHDTGLKMRPIKTTKIEIIAADLRPAKRLFGKYFRGMEFEDGHKVLNLDKSERSVEEQLTWIQDRPDLKLEEALFVRGLLRIDAVEPEEEFEEEDFILADQETRIINTRIFRYDEETGAMDKIPVSFHIRKVTEIDNRKHIAATGRSQMETRTREWQRSENHLLKEDLAKSIIAYPEGLLIDGELCVDENRDAWENLVWYPWYDFVVDEVFRGVQVDLEL